MMTMEEMIAEGRRLEKEKFLQKQEAELTERLENTGLEVNNIIIKEGSQGFKFLSADVVNHPEYKKVYVEYIVQTYSSERFFKPYLKATAKTHNDKLKAIKKN